MNHHGNEMNTNVHEFPLLSRGFFKLILPLAKNNIRELVPCCFESVTVEISLDCYVPLPNQPFRLVFTKSSNATID
jgi:hypothetical protein